MIEPATNWMRTWAPSGVNGGLTAGAGKSLTLHVNADCGANVESRHWWLIGLRNQAWRVPIRSPCGVIRNE
jgi:hypothetical protein